jgi:hypothetical protein
MDQMLAWTFVHREMMRRFDKRPRNDDAFYRGDRESQAWRLLGALWPRLRRGR